MIECDSCGNQMVDDFITYEPTHVEINVPGEKKQRVYESHSFKLCSECRRKIVDWIDECSESDTWVDPVQMGEFIGQLRDNSNKLESIADELEEVCE